MTKVNVPMTTMTTMTMTTMNHDHHDHDHMTKPAAPRDQSGSRKEAYDKAFQKGGKKEPTLHFDGKHGPHFHPAGKFKAWHYYFSLIFGLFGYTDD